jgi:hypothetical protein
MPRRGTIKDKSTDSPFEGVRQAKPGGSCQLRGADHVNCLSYM